MTDTLDPTELDHLRRAIQISVDARAHGNHPFGAILVTDDPATFEGAVTGIQTDGLTEYVLIDDGRGTTTHVRLYDITTLAVK